MHHRVHLPKLRPCRREDLRLKTGVVDRPPRHPRERTLEGEALLAYPCGKGVLIVWHVDARRDDW